MRIAIVNWNRRIVGGVETYLDNLIPQLATQNDAFAFWSEVDQPHDRQQIRLPENMKVWCAASMGHAAALSALREWQPDILFVHKITTPALEAELLEIAPAILFAHDYTGTCISGGKTFKSPRYLPCQREFGWKCLLHYYPHRCGGLNPMTMVELFQVQRARRKHLDRYEAVLTFSTHLAREYMNNGVDENRIHSLPPLVGKSFHVNGNRDNGKANAAFATDITNNHPVKTNGSQQLLFIGRMDRLKGGHVFLEALPEVSRSLGVPLSVIFAGDGPEAQKWKEQSSKLERTHPDIQVKFVGWMRNEELQPIWSQTNLLVLPSLWPEPFGLVGLEAGMHGVPVAAFSVGGISTWLRDGVNGYLAPGDPPTSTGLAHAIVKCLQDSEINSRLNAGALKVAEEFRGPHHVTALMNVFEEVLSRN